MKQFCCGDVVPGCKAMFRADDEPGILSQVAFHARQEHGLTEIPPTLLAQVQGAIQDVHPAL